MLFNTTYRPPQKFVYVQFILEQQQQTIRYTVLKCKHDVPVNWIEAESAADLVKKAGKSLPYVLHFRGFGILTRIAENIPGYREALLVSGHEEDFYFNSMSFQGTVGVSFLRRSLVDSLIEELRLLKVFLWSVHAGPVPSLALIKGQSCSMAYDFSIEFSGGDLRKIERNQDGVRFLPGTFYTEDEMYANAVRQITGEENEAYSDGFTAEEHTIVRSDYKEFIRFVKLGVGMLGIFFLALVGNYFYINFLNDKAAQLEADIAGFGEDLAMTDRLEQEKSRKTILVENSGVQSQRYLTFYLDQLGASVPSTIQLETLEAFPLEEALKPKRKVELNREMILVSGFSSDSKVLDDWMEKLEKKKWINGVELINYVRITDGKATFQLQVKIRS